MYDWAELRHFRYLLSILELQGFRAAAEALRTSQPNLSVQAKQFQENASVRLYRKTKSGRIRITDTGIAFMSMARLLLETRDQVIDALSAIERGEIKSVRFGAAVLADSNLFQEFCALHKAMLPSAAIRPSYSDTVALATEVMDGQLDAAIVTLPLENPELQIELIRRDRLVVCLRQDDPRASKAILRPTDLQHSPMVLYHPDRQRDAHERILEFLGQKGINIEECSRASHPSEIQLLVKDGYGFAFVREGTALHEQLITRPVAGITWTVDTVAIYRKSRHPKTIPLIVKQMKQRHSGSAPLVTTPMMHDLSVISEQTKRPVQSVRPPEQLSLLSESPLNSSDCA